MSKMSGEESEVVFDQPEKKAGAMEPDGPVPNTGVTGSGQDGPQRWY